MPCVTCCPWTLTLSARQYRPFCIRGQKEFLENAMGGGEEMTSGASRVERMDDWRGHGHPVRRAGA